MKEVNRSIPEKKHAPISAFTPHPEQAELTSELSLMSEIIDTIAPGKGPQAVVSICQELAGTYVYFMQDKKMFRKARDKWIIQQYDKGYRVVEIARSVGLSERQLWSILGR